MEEAREVWNLLEEQVLLLGTPREVEGTPGCALPPPRGWCAWRDLGRLAKRPSAIILNSGEKKKTETNTQTNERNHYIFRSNTAFYDTKKGMTSFVPQLFQVICNLTCLQRDRVI